MDATTALPRDIPVIEVALLPPGQCGAHILGAFEALPPGGAFEIVVGHDPLPMKRRIAAEWPGAAHWTYLEQGPTTWRVRVERVR